MAAYVALPLPFGAVASENTNAVTNETLHTGSEYHFRRCMKRRPPVLDGGFCTPARQRCSTVCVWDILLGPDIRGKISETQKSSFLGNENAIHRFLLRDSRHPLHAHHPRYIVNDRDECSVVCNMESRSYAPQQTEYNDESNQVLYENENFYGAGQTGEYSRGSPNRDQRARSSLSHTTNNVDGSGQQIYDPNAATWRRQNAALVQCARQYGMDAAIEMLWEASRQGKAASQNFNQVISLLASRGRFEDGLELAREAGRREFANIITFRPLMKHCCSNGNGAMAKRVWDVTLECGVLPDMFLCAEFMGALVRSLDIPEAEQVLQSIVESGRRPHVVLYNTLLKGIAKQANVPHAFSLLQGMIQQRVNPDETTFNTLLNTCVRAKDLGAVNKAMMLMREHNVKPGVPTFNTLLKLYARAGKFEDALDIFREMQQTVEPSIVTFNTLIDGCAHRGDMERAAEFFNEMLTRGMEPDICTMTSLLKGFGRSNDPERAVELYEAMKDGGYRIEERTRYAVINACLRGDDRENARRLMKEMLESNFTVRMRTWIWRLQRDIANDDERAALETLREMETNSTFPDPLAKASILREARDRSGFLQFQREWKAIRTVAPTTEKYGRDYY